MSVPCPKKKDLVISMKELNEVQVVFYSALRNLSCHQLPQVIWAKHISACIW